MLILVDFDGTITKQDTIDELLRRYAKDNYLQIEERWLRNEINSKECLVSQLELVNENETTIKEYLENIPIDSSFKNFYDFAKEIATIIIISDGIDYPILAMLNKMGIDDLVFYSNTLHFMKDRISISFPNSSDSCLIQSGVCKCEIMNKYRENKTEKTILIGNGKSDCCLAHVVDIVFAKDYLATYCAENGIPYVAYQSFSDILEYMSRPQYK